MYSCKYNAWRDIRRYIWREKGKKSATRTRERQNRARTYTQYNDPRTNCRRVSWRKGWVAGERSFKFTTLPASRQPRRRTYSPAVGSGLTIAAAAHCRKYASSRVVVWGCVSAADSRPDNITLALPIVPSPPSVNRIQPRGRFNAAADRKLSSAPIYPAPGVGGLGEKKTEWNGARMERDVGRRREESVYANVCVKETRPHNGPFYTTRIILYE